MKSSEILNINEKNNCNLSKDMKRKFIMITDKILNDFNKNNKYINLYITDSSEIKNINKRYRKIDEETDVISFSLEDEYDNCLGEIIISEEYVKNKYDNYEKCMQKMLIHGILHILGYDHKTEKTYTEMIEIQEGYLKDFYEKKE